MESDRRVSLLLRMREHTKEGERNDKTLEQIVSFDLPPVSSIIATVSHRTTRLLLLETQLRNSDFS